MWGNFKGRLRENRQGARTGALTTVLVGLALLYLPIGNPFVHYSFDIPALLSPTKIPEEVLILQLDESTYTELHQPYTKFDRRYYAQLLDKLAVGGARLVAFDVYFPRSDPRPDEDAALAEAIRAYGHVVLAADYEYIHGMIGGKVNLPLQSLLDAGAAWGLIKLDYDTDPTVRKLNPGTEDHPSLAWVAAQLLDAPVTRTPENRQQERWLKYYGPHETVPSRSFYWALEQKPEFFKDKVVFIGGKPNTRLLHEESDEFHSPFTHVGGGFISGVEVHATTFLNLLRGDWLTRISPGAEFLALVLCGALLGAFLALWHPWPGAAVAAGAFFAIGLVAWLLFIYRHFWFSWLLMAGAQVPCAWLCAVVWHTRKLFQQKRVLEQQLAGAGGATLPSPLWTPGTAPSPSPASPLPPIVPPTALPPHAGTRLVAHIADHNLIRRIGKGAYGEVYLVQSAIGLYHAAKVVYRGDFNDSGPYEREFRGIQKYMPISMNHPALVHLLHVGRNDAAGHFYYIMELGDDAVNGAQIDPQTYIARNLSRELQQRSRLPARECVRLFLSLTEALTYLHGQHLIHRDIKPSNIIYVNDVPKFADIGLVTDIADPGHDVTYIGTEGYIAPEGPGSPAADIFSLGMVLYECATGVHRRRFPEWPEALTQSPDQQLLPALKRVILRACGKELNQRYGAAAEMHAELHDLERLSA